MDQLEYKHFFTGSLRIPETWKDHIAEMLENIDKELRIKWLPKPLSNFLLRFSKKNKIKEIKTSFGELKIIGDLSDKIKDIVRETKEKCRNTCEFCGSNDTEKITIKSWVYNCCKDCKK